MSWTTSSPHSPDGLGPGVSGVGPRLAAGTFGDGAPVGGGRSLPDSGYGHTPGRVRGQPQVETHADHGLGQPIRTVPQMGQPMPEPNDPMPASVRRVAEGLRGLSTRTTVYLRYVSYLLFIVLGSSVTQWAMSGSIWRNGGKFMFFSAVLMAVTGAVGTWFYTNHRNEILEQFKHYVFGITIVPGTALALLYRAAQSIFSSPAARSDAFLSTMANALPILMFATVVIPAALFVKVVAGLRSLHRSRLDDQEAMNTYTRIDPWMR